jgi:predicted GIY-YIG superfamily endonuclease
MKGMLSFLLFNHLYPYKMLQFVYNLELVEGKTYVGITNDMTRRLAQHLTLQGAQWTKRFKVIRLRHSESFTKQSKEQMAQIEDNFTLSAMSRQGIENVRGGSWSNVQLIPLEIERLLTLVKPIEGKCIICGKPEHGICSYRVSKYSLEGMETEMDNTEEPEIILKPRKTAMKVQAKASFKQAKHCSRCGHTGHNKSVCNAKTRHDGTPL